MLGICFGHQLIAHAFGGKVGYNRFGWELGLVDVHFKSTAQNDLLFSLFPDRIQVQASHAQSVIELPPGAVRIASNQVEKNHVFCLNSKIWGVQFHPEFNCEITKAYIGHHKDELLAENKDPGYLARACRDSK